MAIQRDREVTLDKYRLTRMITFDATMAYIADHIGLWANRLGDITHKKILKKMTPYTLLATTLFNVASGHWHVLKYPFAGTTDNKQKNTRTPRKTFEMNYLTIVPNYVTDLISCVTDIRNAVEARDWATADASSAKMVRVLQENVAEVPKCVEKYVESLPKLSDVFTIVRKQPGKLGGFPESALKIKKNVPEAVLYDTFGRYIVYKSDRVPVMRQEIRSNNVDEPQE